MRKLGRFFIALERRDVAIARMHRAEIAGWRTMAASNFLREYV
jgi:hypothetical protein